MQLPSELGKLSNKFWKRGSSVRSTPNRTDSGAIVTGQRISLWSPDAECQGISSRCHTHMISTHAKTRKRVRSEHSFSRWDLSSEEKNKFPWFWLVFDVLCVFPGLVFLGLGKILSGKLKCSCFSRSWEISVFLIFPPLVLFCWENNSVISLT